MVVFQYFVFRESWEKSLVFQGGDESDNPPQPILSIIPASYPAVIGRLRLASRLYWRFHTYR